jgi:hypothetical protein
MDRAAQETKQLQICNQEEDQAKNEEAQQISKEPIIRMRG